MFLCTGLCVTALPLDPSLARALLAAEELGCLDQALTVAAMLSCENIFFQPPRYVIRVCLSLSKGYVTEFCHMATEN